MGYVEETRRQYLHTNTTAFTQTTITATTITTITTTNITIGATTTATKAKDIKAKNLGNNETVLNSIENTMHMQIVKRKSQQCFRNSLWRYLV